MWTNPGPSAAAEDDERYCSGIPGLARRDLAAIALALTAQRADRFV